MPSAAAARIGAVVTLLLLGGCFAGGPDETSSPSSGGTTLSRPEASGVPDGAEVPAFSGTWAAEFERTYRASTSDLQREVLADGRVTEQEMLALQDDFRSCLEARGFTGVAFDARGGFELKPPDSLSDSEVQPLVTGCQSTTIGQVDTLFNGLQRNPGNEDEFDVMAGCLVRQGLAPADYDAEDYGRDAPADTFPFDSNDARFSACVADPLAAGS